MKITIDDINRWKSYGFVMTPTKNKIPLGETWRKDWADEDLVNAQQLAFYHKESGAQTVDFDDLSFVAHGYSSLLPATFTDGKVVNGKVIATHKTYKINGSGAAKFQYPKNKSKAEGLILETIYSKLAVFAGKDRVVINDVPPAEIDNKDLINRLKLISFMQEVQKKWVKVGNKQSDEAHLRLAAALARLDEKAYSTSLLEAAVEQLCLNVGDKEIKNRINKISYQREQLSNGVETVYEIGELGKFLNANFPAYDLFKDKPKKEYPLIDSNTFSQIEYVKPKFLMYPLITDKGANCIYGNTGSGKTLFAMAMAIHIASKRNFLDWQVQNAAPVLYVEGELPADDIRDRRNSIFQDFIDKNIPIRHEWIYFLTIDDAQMHGFDDIEPLATRRGDAAADQKDYAITGRKLIENLQERIFKKCGVKPLTFLDNIGCLTDIDENKQMDWSPFLDWTIRRKNRGYPCVWEHHSNKVGLSAGSEAKRRSLNTEMCLEELADDFRFNMAGSKNLQTKITFTKKRHFGGSSWSKPKILTMNEMGLWKCYPVLKKSDFRIIELYNSGVTKIDDIAADDDVTVKKASIYNKIKEFQKEGFIK